MGVENKEHTFIHLGSLPLIGANHSPLKVSSIALSHVHAPDYLDGCSASVFSVKKVNLTNVKKSVNLPT